MTDKLPPHHQTLLTETDWACLQTAFGTGESLPAALARLLDPDPAVRAHAVTHALGQVIHQNTIYEATTPVALYIAGVLGDPALAMDDIGHDADEPTLVTLLKWLGDTAYDADDECLALAELPDSTGGPFVCVDMRAFREQRPAIFAAVRPHLTHDDARVRDTALVTAIPLAEHPDLTAHRDELTGHAHRLLATNTDRYQRDRVLDALRAWGHDTSGLENASDMEARERYARLRAAREAWAGLAREGKFSEWPAF
ncbi:hypothetical protein [Kitasatospora cathayae]|uniref:HEAT repeat domain-containing protein n=1 Tax=Kitasatospora cathayae TaxID=3004092 RepID=A0ABY7QCN9_9ACTN|nr:hypothetical protein [Kitasatospora sp. HUAS 3-15]WBP90406.1 hypothetical protein O1G21_34135 [Kitasatospora sp. HUAS 3-15]